MKKDLKDELKRIDNFFNNLSIEEYEEVALECGMDKESHGRIMFDVEEDYMDEQVAIAFFKQDVAWLKSELKEPVGIKTMMSALESRVCAEELAIEALNERMEKDWISMSERLPEGDCLVYEANSRRVLFCYGDEYEAADWNVTYWMPKPKPPVNK